LIFCKELRLNLIYGSKKGRNEEIELVSDSHLKDDKDHISFIINYHEEKKNKSTKDAENEVRRSNFLILEIWAS
jgi:hypothetical protein